jgi:flavin reductase (DIM6/NTAB) family NADH-FMN oxidoreductase RutF
VSPGVRGTAPAAQIREREVPTMDPVARKTALRMITVNWVTQASFEPPLVVVGVKADSSAHEVVKESGAFCLNVLGKGQEATAFGFFKPVQREGDRIGGERFRTGRTGAPILEAAPAWLECSLVETVEKGCHSVFVAEVLDAGVASTPEGRPDALTLRLEDLGEKTFYGG